MPVTGNQGLLRQLNRFAILREVLRQPGISRAELATRIGLTRAAIGRLVHGLQVDGWLGQQRGEQVEHSNRRAVPLLLDARRRVLLGAQVNAERSRLVATTLSGVPLEYSVERVEGFDGRRVMATLADQVEAMHIAFSAEGRHVCGLGVAVPGPVVHPWGILRFSETTGWRELPVRVLLRGRLLAAGISGMPLVVERAVNCMAVQHAEAHVMRQAGNTLYIHLGKGVAVAMMNGTELVHGSQGLAGYVAHQTLDVNGPLCRCGRAGCVVALLGLDALGAAMGLPTDGPGHALKREMRTRLQANDPAALAALDKFARDLGRLVFNLVQTSDPGRIVLGGGAFQLGVDLLERVHEEVVGLYGAGLGPPSMAVTHYDTWTAAQGAAALAFRSQLLSPQDAADARQRPCDL